LINVTILIIKKDDTQKDIYSIKPTNLLSIFDVYLRTTQAKVIYCINFFFFFFFFFFIIFKEKKKKDKNKLFILIK